MSSRLIWLTLAILLLFTLNGCISRNLTGVGAHLVDDPNDPSIFVPERDKIRGAPMGNDSYSVGWRAGCQVNLSLVGAGTMRLLKEHVDPEKLSTDKMYLRGYMDGTNFCQDRMDWEGH